MLVDAPQDRRTTLVRRLLAAIPQTEGLLTAVGPVLLVAAFSAFSVALMCGISVRELRLHLMERNADCVVLGPLALGTAIGLWLPNHWMRRNAAAGRDCAPPPTAVSITTLALAVLALLGGAATSGLERWREVLATQTVAPAAFRWIALLAPISILQVALGISAALMLVAVNCWHRAAQRQRLHTAQLWGAWLFAAAVGGSVALLVQDPNRLWHLPALLLFVVAGASALVRRHGAAAPAIHEGHTESKRTYSLAAAAMAAVIGVGISEPIRGIPTGGLLEQPFVAVSWGAVVGLVLSRVLLRVGMGSDFAPLLAILGSFVLVQTGFGMSRLTVVCALVVAGIALLARRAARSCRNIQDALWLVGGSAATSLAMTSFVSSLLISASRSFTWAMALLTLANLTLGVLLLVDAGYGRPGRAAALTALAMWLLTAPASRDLSPALLEGGEVRLSEGAQAARNALDAGLDSREFRADAALGLVDFDGFSAELVIVPSPVGSGARLRVPIASRTLRRIGRMLTAGGRIVLEKPLDPSLEQVVTRYSGRTNPPFGPAYELRVEGPGTDYEAVIIGRDVAQWVSGRAWPPGYDATLRPFGADESVAAADPQPGEH
ncbi:MAG: hypothetical protein HZB38_00645 [Planctomycetes bacterium]|nr:hypothetical protein [Planctomycetota bacterium]